MSNNNNNVNTNAAAQQQQQQPLIRGTLTVINDTLECKLKPRNVAVLTRMTELGMHKHQPYVELERFRLANVAQIVYVGLCGDRVAPLQRKTWREGPFNWPLIKRALVLNNQFMDSSKQHMVIQELDRTRWYHMRDLVAKYWRSYRRNKLMFRRWKAYEQRHPLDDGALFKIHYYHQQQRRAKVNLYNVCRRFRSYRVDDCYMLPKCIVECKDN